MTDKLTRLNTVLLFLEGTNFPYQFLALRGGGGEGKKQRLLRLKDFCVKIHQFTY